MNLKLINRTYLNLSARWRSYNITGGNAIKINRCDAKCVLHKHVVNAVCIVVISHSDRSWFLIILFFFLLLRFGTLRNFNYECLYSNLHITTTYSFPLTVVQIHIFNP